MENNRWARYGDDELDRMLRSYRDLSRRHSESCHWALAHWASDCCTQITVEMNRRYAYDREMASAQLTLDETAT